jgi:hypothetical protein
MFIDPKTAAKMVFISGDMTDGSPNDIQMKQLCGKYIKFVFVVK